MADGPSITWQGNPFSEIMLGCGCFPFAMLLAVALTKIFSLPDESWIVVVLACVALGMVAGMFTVHTAEFTKQWVRLMSNARTRLRDVADLETVEIVHSGDTEKGYTQTSLRLTWSGDERATDVIDGDYDSALAASLARVLGSRPQMKERWKTLKPPPPEP